MVPAPRVAGRVLLLAGVFALALSACGRRGALQPPPDASASAQVEEPAPAEGSVLPQATPRPQRAPQRGYTIPDRPFILDPLL